MKQQNFLLMTAIVVAVELFNADYKFCRCRTNLRKSLFGTNFCGEAIGRDQFHLTREGLRCASTAAFIEIQ